MGRKEVQEIVALFEAAARALHVAHEAGVVHRDVKPANIMIDRQGHPIVLDFGLASAEDLDLETLTQSGDLFGTPAFMSPEQLTRGTLRLDRRTDVYSLGAALFEAPSREGLYQAILNPASIR